MGASEQLSGNGKSTLESLAALKLTYVFDEKTPLTPNTPQGSRSQPRSAASGCHDSGSDASRSNGSRAEVACGFFLPPARHDYGPLDAERFRSGFQAQHDHKIA